MSDTKYKKERKRYPKVISGYEKESIKAFSRVMNRSVEEITKKLVKFTKSAKS